MVWSYYIAITHFISGIGILFIGGYTVVVADPVALEGMLELEKKSITSRFSGADAAVSWILKKKNLPDILYFALVSNVRFSSVSLYIHKEALSCNIFRSAQNQQVSICLSTVTAGLHLGGLGSFLEHTSPKSLISSSKCNYGKNTCKGYLKGIKNLRTRPPFVQSTSTGVVTLAIFPGITKFYSARNSA